jgi:hypothetical protein
MILFVFEGVKREPDLFRTIQRTYFTIVINTKKRQWKNLQKHLLMNR